MRGLLLLASAWVALSGCRPQAEAQHSAPPPAPALRIRQLDVGQGDAALITTRDGKHILIDAGRSSDAVALLLRAEHVDTIDLAIASHNHADHIGGMPAVFQVAVVRAYVDNGIPATTQIYARTLDALEREPGVRYLAATDRTITLGAVSVRILPPPLADQTQNDNSVGVIVRYQGFAALYTGDSERDELDRWAAAATLPRVALLKAAHHGSLNGITDALITATQPRVVVVSVGARNSYGHPSPNVIAAWERTGAQVLRTDRDGTIEVDVAADGTYRVTTAVKSPRPVR